MVTFELKFCCFFSKQDKQTFFLSIWIQDKVENVKKNRAEKISVYHVFAQKGLKTINH